MNITKLELFIDTLLNEYDREWPWCSLGIIKGNELILKKSYWYANIENSILCSEHTNFRLASLTKQFTAICVLDLLDKNSIDLHDSIWRYLTEFVNNPDITIYHLLTHTSGLLDYEDIMTNHRTNPISDREVLQILSQQKKHKFTPWTHRSYNNWGYCILKELIEKISNISYWEYLEQYIFNPFGMNTSTLSIRDSSPITHRAIGYSILDKSFIMTDNDLTSLTMWDGSIYSSVYDLSQRIIKRTTILPSTIIKLAEQCHTTTDEKDIYYGLWLFITTLSWYKMLFHWGSSIGFRTGMCYLPEKELGVIFLSNYNGNEGSIFTQHILTYLLNNLM